MKDEILNEQKLNLKLEDIVGVDAGNRMFNKAEEYAAQMSQNFGVALRGTEYRCCFYASMVDELLSHMSKGSDKLYKPSFKGEGRYIGYEEP